MQGETLKNTNNFIVLYVQCAHNIVHILQQN